MTPQRELVIGASGLVGSWLMRCLRERGDSEVTGTYYRHAAAGLRPLDMTAPAAVDTLLEQANPDVIYLPAANPNVEWIESEPEASRAVNVAPVLGLIDRLKGANTKLVYYSSDYVFDGKNGPYTEEDAPNPICEYGRQKWEVEQVIRERLGENGLIFRVTVVYGWEDQGKNFVQRCVRQLRAGEVTLLRVPSDQVGNPSYAPNLADAAAELVRRGASGVYNLAGSERTSRYEFAREMARVFQLSEEAIQPVSTTELNQRAARPLNAGMVVSKAQSLLGDAISLADYRTGLRRMKESERAFYDA